MNNYEVKINNKYAQTDEEWEIIRTKTYTCKIHMMELESYTCAIACDGTQSST